MKAALTLSLTKTIFIIVFPFISYLSVNYHFLPLGNFIYFTVLSCAIVSIVLCLFCIFLYKVVKFRDFNRMLFVFDVIFLFFFLFDFVLGFGKIITSSFALSRGATALYPLIGVPIILFAFFISKYKLPHLFVLLFALLVVSFNVVKLIWLGMMPQKEIIPSKTINLSFDNAAIRNKRNVYYVIADSYPSLKVLEEEFLWEADDFLVKLNKFGFYHAKNAFSSYNMTHLTLASIFDMDYMLDENSPKYSDHSSFYPSILNKLEEPNLIKITKSLGYEFYIFGNSWADCAGRIKRCIEEAKYYIPYYALIFLSNTPILLLYHKLFLPYLQADTKKEYSYTAKVAKQNDAIAKVLSHLRQSGIPDKASFMFIHHLAPHVPHILNPDCSIKEEVDIRNNKNLKNENLNEVKKGFLDNLKCANRKIIEFADFITKNDPEAIVVFQGDHGYGKLEMRGFEIKRNDFSRPLQEWPAKWIRSRMSILNLLRVPDDCKQWLYPEINNINSVRLVLSCAIKQKPSFVKNKAYIGGAENNPDFGTVRRVQIIQ